jgi:hypothetical protein
MKREDNAVAGLFLNCTICGRPLKNFNSQKRGTGPICCSKNTKEIEEMNKGQIDLFGHQFHAEFTIEEKPNGVLFLVDTGHSHTKTVTNDAEYVVSQLVVFYGNLTGRTIYYRDSMNRVDELVVSNNKFAGFKAGPAHFNTPEPLGIF